MPRIINWAYRQNKTIRKFSERELFDAVERHKLTVPVFELIRYGKRCGWRRKDGKAFWSVDGFAKAYDEVYRRRLKNKKEYDKKKRMPFGWKLEGVVVNGARCYPAERDSKGMLIERRPVMTKTLYMELGWIKLYVDVDVCDGMIDSVVSVSAEGTEKPLKCDKNEFLKCFDGELAELLEEDIRNDKIAYAEMQMDAKNEEGI